jgi:hypothetical protein
LERAVVERARDLKACLGAELKLAAAGVRELHEAARRRVGVGVGNHPALVIFGLEDRLHTQVG